jgi:uncharacterized surface protein with fasciclin (FAS1) repeats
MRPVLVLAALCGTACGFQLRPVGRPATRLRDVADLEGALTEAHPRFAAMLFGNADLCKQISGLDTFTVLAPSEAAFDGLDDKLREQLVDPRNGEVVERIATFHVIGERVSKDELYDSAGVVTLGGRIEVGRSTTGGLFGIGATEDGGVTINGAKIESSTENESFIVHAVDGLCSPKTLLRYMDQLRIPGSS